MGHTRSKETGNIGYTRRGRKKEKKQSRETGNIGYTRRGRKKKKTQRKMCWTPLYTNKHILRPIE